MSANRSFDDVARAWLDLMPDEAPDHAIAAVLQAVEVTPQRRPRPIGPWRVIPMGRLALVGAMAVIIATGSFLLLTRPRQDVSNQPSASPSPSGSPSAVGGGPPLADALRSTWVAFANEDPVLSTGAGPVSLLVSPVGTSVAAENFGPGHGYASTAIQAAPDQIEVVLARSGGGCLEGDRGVYRVQVNDDRSHLILTSISDACANRARVFVRTWVRSLDDPSNVGAGAITALDPGFSIVLPDDEYQTRHLTDFVEIAGSNVSLMVHKNPQPFVDPCSTAEERVPYKAGAQAFVDFFKGNDAYEVTDVAAFRVDGHAGLHATVGGKANYARCPGQALYEYTPKNCVCHFIVGQGGADSMYLVEVGADTYLFIVSPIGLATERQIIDSIQIPFQLPSD